MKTRKIILIILSSFLIIGGLGNYLNPDTNSELQGMFMGFILTGFETILSILMYNLIKRKKKSTKLEIIILILIFIPIIIVPIDIFYEQPLFLVPVVTITGIYLINVISKKFKLNLFFKIIIYVLLTFIIMIIKFFVFEIIFNNQAIEKDCSNLRGEVQEYLDNEGYTKRILKEIFYSKEKNSCLYHIDGSTAKANREIISDSYSHKGILTSRCGRNDPENNPFECIMDKEAFQKRLKELKGK